MNERIIFGTGGWTRNLQKPTERCVGKNRETKSLINYEQG